MLASLSPAAKACTEAEGRPNNIALLQPIYPGSLGLFYILDTVAIYSVVYVEGSAPWLFDSILFKNSNNLNIR